MGYSEQKTLLLLTSEEEISVFLNVSVPEPQHGF
jgi:hypothetical protein